MTVMGRPKAPCGTESAYRRHKKAGERIDDLCQGWKNADQAGIELVPVAKAGAKAPKSAKRIEREVDFVQETLLNLQFVERAMATASADKIGPLSKRKSELLRELKDYKDAEGTGAPAVDPLEDDLTNGASLENVTQFPTAASA